jgi:hypothetical protein
MDKEIVEEFKERLDVFDDSPEVVELLLPINDYVAQEAAVHIEGLWKLAIQMMAYIEERTS